MCFVLYSKRLRLRRSSGAPTYAVQVVLLISVQHPHRKGVLKSLATPPIPLPHDARMFMRRCHQMNFQGASPQQHHSPPGSHSHCYGTLPWRRARARCQLLSAQLANGPKRAALRCFGLSREFELRQILQQIIIKVTLSKLTPKSRTLVFSAFTIFSCMQLHEYQSRWQTLSLMLLSCYYA